MLDVATRAGTTEAGVSRWESRSTRCPDRLDDLIDAYAHETGVAAYTLWKRALDAWRTAAKD